MAFNRSGVQELRISSEFRNGRAVRAFVRGVAEECNLGSDAIADLVLAVTEVFNNAVEHAHRFEASREVVIRAHRCAKGLHVDVADEGPGFSPAEVADPSPVQPTQRGLGLFLARQLVDHLEFSHGSGTTVHLVKAAACS